jgi:AcrR family transcriptional regulator
MARPLSDDAREAMVAGARALIATEGVHACTVEAVARRTGIAKTTIYRHLGNQDGLVLAALDGMVKATPAPDTGSLRGDLRVIQERYLRVADDPRMRELYWWLLTRSAQDREFAERFRKVRVQPHGPTVIALQRAIARGEVAPTLDVDLAMHLIQGPFMHMRFVENEEVPEEVVDLLVDQIVAGLTAGAPRRPRRR